MCIRDRLLLVDIAVPRDIDAACGDLAGVTLYDMDDLQTRVAHTISTREMESLRAETIVEEEITRFAEWLGTLAVAPTIRALRDYGDAIVEQVLAENKARSVMNRLLHEPTLRLRTMTEGRSHGRLQIMREPVSYTHLTLPTICSV